MAAPKSKVLLVIASEENWYTEFKNLKLADGSSVVVEQTRWKYLHAEASSKEGEKLVCSLNANEAPFEGTSQTQDRDVKPDFFLFRNFPMELHGLNYRPVVMALCFSGIKGVNSPSSVLRSMDRPVFHAELLRIRERLGKDKFPTIDMKFHCNGYNGTKQRLIDMEFPTVVKVGTAHAGYGKSVVKSKGDYFDLESILAMSTEYFTEEPFTEHDYEFRVQVIGPHVRTFRRNSDSSWKNNWGNVRFEDHPWKEKYQIWVDEIRKIFGGLDMFALDILHRNKKNVDGSGAGGGGDDGEDVILEVNDYAMGLDYEFSVEDMKHIRELVLQRMNEEFCGTKKADYLGQFVLSKYKRGELKGITYLKSEKN